MLQETCDGYSPSFHFLNNKVIKTMKQHKLKYGNTCTKTPFSDKGLEVCYEFSVRLIFF